MAVQQTTSVNQLELFEERAAIMEYEGKMARNHAEDMARRDVWPFLPITQAQRHQFEAAHWSAGKALRFLERKTRWKKQVNQRSPDTIGIDGIFIQKNGNQ